MLRLAITVQIVSVAALIARTVDSVLDGVIYAAAVIAALEVLRRTIGAKLIRLYRKTDAAVDEIMKMPGRLDRVERKVDRVERKVDRVEQASSV